MSYEGFTGAIRLFDGDIEIDRIYAGHADRANRRPNGPRTEFGMASGSKAFTAVGILYLSDQGFLGLDDRARELAADDRIDAAITLHQLLTHTSGIADYFDEETMDDYEELWRELPNYRMRKSDDFLPLFLGQPNTFSPGARFSYSNGSYVLLAYLIERVTRRSFPDYLHDIIFAKCGMESTGYFSLDVPVANMATGYTGDGDTLRSNIYSIPPAGGGDGGCFTNGEDMNRFWRALASGKILEPETTRAMLSVQIPQTGGRDRYGLGIWIDAQDEDIVFVQGFDPGVRFLSYLRRSTGRTLTICANVECKLRPIVEDFKKKL
jgi:Beta-lactamase class C and other penicillin binding proteins